METNRLVIKIAGESGQGVNSLGEIVLHVLKKSNYYVFGYREYPSLIHGGYASYQIDIGDTEINSSSTQVDLSICFTKRAIRNVVNEIREGGILIHNVRRLDVEKEVMDVIEKSKIQVIGLDTREILKEIEAPLVMENSILLGLLWKILGLNLVGLEEDFQEKFAKRPELVSKNSQALQKGYSFETDVKIFERVNNLLKNKAKSDITKSYLITGNYALALGALAAGMRAYYSYPMTPASSILTYLSSTYKDHKAVVKQAEDEISAAQMTIGSMYAGTRAMTGTSGGGFDLMSESLTLAAMAEIPFVCVIGQRPGPATGLPTWTQQGDLNLAVYSGHGEYTRCVIAVSDPKSAYIQIQHAFNIAEKYQIPVLVLTDKQIAESVYVVDKFDEDLPIERHLLSAAEVDSAENIKRYEITESGLSPRWLPGTSNKTYIANGDEHFENGRITENAEEIKQIYKKRMDKLNTLKIEIPEPEYFGPENPELLLVGWGSVKGMIMDGIKLSGKNNVGYLHYEYLYPLKFDKLEGLGKNAKSVKVLEQNYMGQFGALLRAEGCTVKFDKVSKFDGRPFFLEEISRMLDVTTN